jgi:hypothetical protein
MKADTKWSNRLIDTIYQMFLLCAFDWQENGYLWLLKINGFDGRSSPSILPHMLDIKFLISQYNNG